MSISYKVAVLRYTIGMAKKLFESQHDDEEVLEVFRQHPVVLRKGLYGFLILTTLGLVPVSIWPEQLEYLWAIPAGAVLGAIVLFYFWIGWYFTLFIITDQRFIRILQKGLFNRNVVDLGLDKIQNVNYQVSGLQQTLLKFGTIVVQTFVGDLVLEKIHHPQEVQESLIRIIKQSGNQIKED